MSEHDTTINYKCPNCGTTGAFMQKGRDISNVHIGCLKCMDIYPVIDNLLDAAKPGEVTYKSQAELQSMLRERGADKEPAMFIDEGDHTPLRKEQLEQGDYKKDAEVLDDPEFKSAEKIREFNYRVDYVKEHGHLPPEKDNIDNAIWHIKQAYLEILQHELNNTKDI